jgi:nucleotide-binding universal stress UspA family protein
MFVHTRAAGLIHIKSRSHRIATMALHSPPSRTPSRNPLRSLQRTQLETIMYKHILVPTDGSKLSDRAVKEAVALASTLNAKVTLLHVAPVQIWPIYAESAVVMAEYSPGDFQAETKRQAAALLAKAAKRAGTGVATLSVLSDLPYDAIIKAAAKAKCDLIVMASHGRRGVSGFLIGSETQKVLTHSKVPVLVVR